MNIDKNFYLSGFSRVDFGENGVVFERWETPEAKEVTPTISERGYYGYSGGELHYTITLPKPPKPILTGLVLINRKSKNRYEFALRGETGVQIGSAYSLHEIEFAVADFFKRTSKGGAE